MQNKCDVQIKYLTLMLGFFFRYFPDQIDIHTGEKKHQLFYYVTRSTLLTFFFVVEESDKRINFRSKLYGKELEKLSIVERTRKFRGFYTI